MILDMPEYKNFLNKVPDIIMLGYGGSHAYGTNTPTSDIDIRGFYRNPLDELLGTKVDSEQYVDKQTDTTIYSMKKMFGLLSNCNPNTIEILGLRDEDYLYMTEEGKIILDQKEIFLSKKAIFTFGQYAASQLNRLINKSGRAKDQALENECRSLSKVTRSMESRYKDLGLDVYLEEDKIYFGMNTSHMSIEDMISLFSELNNVHRDYCKSDRNNKAIEHNKLNKHMMHLLRLYMMGIDILKDHEIVTYRTKEHNLLMDIRNNKYLEDDLKTPTKEFEKLLEDYKRMFDEAAAGTTLPDLPDKEKINQLSMKINLMRI